MNAESVLVWTYLWCSPSGGYTPAHLGAPAAEWAGRRSEQQACPALALSLNSGVKWSSRTPDSSSDRLIKTRPGRADEDCERSMKRFEEQLRSSSANKSAKQEHLERGKEGLWGWVLKRRSSLCWRERKVRGGDSSWYKTESLIDGSLSHLVKKGRHFY